MPPLLLPPHAEGVQDHPSPLQGVRGDGGCPWLALVQYHSILSSPYCKSLRELNQAQFLHRNPSVKHPKLHRWHFLRRKVFPNEIIEKRIRH